MIVEIFQKTTCIVSQTPFLLAFLYQRVQKIKIRNFSASLAAMVGM